VYLRAFFGLAEICSVANGASKKEIGRATKFIVKQLEEDMGISMEMGTIHAGDFLVGLLYLLFSFFASGRDVWESVNQLILVLSSIVMVFFSCLAT
jgi:hypothetical protein